MSGTVLGVISMLHGNTHIFMYVRQQWQPNVRNYNLMSLATMAITAWLKVVCKPITENMPNWTSSYSTFRFWPSSSAPQPTCFKNGICFCDTMRQLVPTARATTSLWSQLPEFLTIWVPKIENSCFCCSQHSRCPPTISREDWNRSSYRNTVLF